MKLLGNIYYCLQYLLQSILGLNEIPVFLFGNNGHDCPELPSRKTKHAVGYDLEIRAIVSTEFDKVNKERRKTLWDFKNAADISIRDEVHENYYVLRPGESVYVSFGFVLGLPPYWWAEIRSRSSTASETIKVWYEGIPIDSDFRGEPMARIQNLGSRDIHIGRGKRLVQLLFHGPFGRWNPRLYQANSMDELTITKRGNGCHGSTGCY